MFNFLTLHYNLYQKIINIKIKYSSQRKLNIDTKTRKRTERLSISVKKIYIINIILFPIKIYNYRPY